MWNSYAAPAAIRLVASLKPPSLVSIIYIIESSLEKNPRDGAKKRSAAK